MDLQTLRGLITLAFLITFLLIVRYAWSTANRARFDREARRLLDADGPPAPAGAARAAGADHA
ncbi:MAG: hypothetical protein AB7G13_07260 [Lautropia sp.]